MSNDLDRLLAGMRDESATAPVGVESALWREIHRRHARSQIRNAIGRNTGIAAAGLAIGIVMAVTRPPPPPKPVAIPLLLTEVPPASLLE
jgi:hypothetical protein